MPVPQPRDPEELRTCLESWLPPRIPGNPSVRIDNLRIPPDGYSNETIYFDAVWDEGAATKREPLVLRVQPRGHQLFFEGDIRDVIFQYRVMEQLGRHGIPVANLRWKEDDPAVLGAPFFLMDHVTGHAPTDSPSYNATGNLVEMGEVRRRRLWQNGIEALAAIHMVDWRDGLGFLSQDHRGEPGLGQQLQFLEDWYTWATRGASIPIVREAMDYVRANAPASEGPVTIVWGDSRIGNMIFDAEDRVAAVTDWELAGLGPPEVDLGWWLFMDHWHAEGHKSTRLPGLPGHEETVETYQRLTGHTVRDLHFYMVLAGLRFGLIVAQSVNERRDMGQVPAELPPELDPAVNNGVSYVLAGLLGLPLPNIP